MPSMEGLVGGDSGYSKHNSTLPHKGPKVCQTSPVSNSSPCHLFQKLEKRKKERKKFKSARHLLTVLNPVCCAPCQAKYVPMPMDAEVLPLF